MTHSTGKVFKLTAAGSIREALGDVVEAKRNITISALFHGLISSNVSWATFMQRNEYLPSSNDIMRHFLWCK